jgi:hypothetical protein
MTNENPLDPYNTESTRPPSPGESAHKWASYLQDLGRVFNLEVNHDALAIIVGDVQTWWRLRKWLRTPRK